MLIRAFHEKNGDTKRTKVIIPDSAHGTNPASANSLLALMLSRLNQMKKGLLMWLI